MADLTMLMMRVCARGRARPRLRTPVTMAGQRGASERDPVTGQPIPYSAFSNNPWSDIPQEERDRAKITSEEDYLSKVNVMPCLFCGGICQGKTGTCVGVFIHGNLIKDRWSPAKIEA